MEIVPIILEGPGPFQMPELSKFDGVDPGHAQGWLLLRFQTDQGSTVHIPVSASAVRLMQAILSPESLEGLRQLRKEKKL